MEAWEKARKWIREKLSEQVFETWFSPVSLVEITDDAVVVESDKGQYSIPADMVITAVGARPLRSLLDSVSGNGMKIITIGDAKEKILNSIGSP